VPTRILIADDSEVVRSSLKSLLSGHADWVVCGEASDGQEAVLLAEKLKPDLIVLDMAMPVLNGLRASAAILRASPLVPIVLYTLYKSDQMDLEGRKAGARNVVSKTESSNVLIQCLEGLLGEARAVTPVSPAGQPPSLGGIAGEQNTSSNDGSGLPDSNAKAKSV
jgi:DNA-binding NarL/FixJ family response regulator